AFFPSSVIKGLLAAIGVILILKQIPHLLGHDKDPEGEMSYNQPDDETTLSEIWRLFEGEIHYGAAAIGIGGIVLLVVWQRYKHILERFLGPGPLAVVIISVFAQLLLRPLGEVWTVDGTHLVKIPVANSASELVGFLKLPDFGEILNPQIYVAAVTIAIVASLETLLNLEAVDNLDPKRRSSPPNRELIAQGAGNLASGFIGGLPVTSVIVRGSVNVNMGAQSKLSTIFHGALLLFCVVLIPGILNMIPKSALAAILIVTGFKLASPKLFRQMFREGRYQFLPFLVTMVSIVFTDLLQGILIGLLVSALFVLNSNLRRPVRRIVETHLGGDILHVELANQVSFLNRAALDKVFDETKPGTQMLIDARESDYIDPDVLSLIRDYKTTRGPARGVTVSLRGFREKYELQDEIQFADYSTRELQDRITPIQALDILREGNRRFVEGSRLTRDFHRQVGETAKGQNPLAVVLSCIDSRVPAELVLDLGIGDIFSVRVAGNIVGQKSLGSIEYGVTVSGVKLVLVLGHTRCGAVTSSVQLLSKGANVEEATGCPHLPTIVEEIEPCFGPEEHSHFQSLTDQDREVFVDEVAKRNVHRTVQEIVSRSCAIRQAVESGQAMVVGALYDVKTGKIEFMVDDAVESQVNA
ncbi:MAG: SulP family inorganic anion transporter, partial [Planctomycetota bacterium]